MLVKTIEATAENATTSSICTDLKYVPFCRTKKVISAAKTARTAR
jgi:hypothetical protein